MWLGFAGLAKCSVRQFNIGGSKMKPATIKKITPILFAQEIEPCIQFCTEKMGFQKTAEVPEGDKIGFVLLEKAGLKLMYQSYPSVEKDNAAAAVAVPKGPTFMNIDSQDVHAAITL